MPRPRLSLAPPAPSHLSLSLSRSLPASSQYVGHLSALALKATSIVRDIDPTNEMMFIRVRSKKNEIMIAPSKDFTLMVLQNPSSE